jgi:hypothetical protein
MADTESADVEMAEEQDVAAMKERLKAAEGNNGEAVPNGEGNNGTNGQHDDRSADSSVKAVEEDDDDDEAAVDEALEELGDVEDEEEDIQEIDDEEEEEEMMRYEENGGADSNSAIELNDDDDEEVEEIDAEEGGAAKVNGERTSRRKSPVRLREIEEVADSEEEEVEEDEDSNDVEEVKDDDDDSDVMEVEAEDPLSGNRSASAQPQQQQKEQPASKSLHIPTSKATVTKPNVVTIDDVKTLHKLAAQSSAAAASARAARENSDKSSSSNLVLIDTNAILAGKATSGVTITPARPKPGGSGSSGASSALSSLPSGVTISSTTKQGPPVPLNKANAVAAAGQNRPAINSSFTYNDKGQLNDPNLTDDTFVVEAPSFIVPYVYEKPPRETFENFKDSIKSLIATLKAKAKEEEESKKADDDDESSKDGKDDDDEVKSVKSASDDDIVEVDKGGQPKPKSENYFESNLGKFVTDLGMNLVQETVQSDLLRQQINRSKKDKSAAVMHAIMSLKKNLEASKAKNELFHFPMKKCRFCSFRSESDLVVQHHLETPHMKQFMYRCNFCPYETKLPAEVLAHMGAQHGVRGRLERAPALHQCPQCPFEDNMKGKLTRHKTSCDKRFRQERNQEAPHDWEPPAKIPKPPVLASAAMAGNRRPMGMNNYGMMGQANAAAFGQSLMGMRGGAGQQAKPSFGQFGQMGQQQKSIYSNMPSLQMGPRGRGRPVGAYKPDMMRGGSPMGRGSPIGMGRQGRFICFGLTKQAWIYLHVFFSGAAMNSMAFNRASKQMLGMAGGGQNYSNAALLNAMQRSQGGGGNVLNNLKSNSSVTIQVRPMPSTH